MGRKSTLSEKQWAEIEKRILAGESVRSLADAFKIAESAIRKRLGARTKTIKTVANQVFEAESAFQALPVSAQISARSMVDRMKIISANLMGAAELGSATSLQMNSIAHEQSKKIDKSDPFSEESVKVIKGIMALTNVANAASEIPMALIRASKEIAASIGSEGQGDGDNLAAPEYVLKTDEPTPARPIL